MEGQCSDTGMSSFDQIDDIEDIAAAAAAAAASPQLHGKADMGQVVVVPRVRKRLPRSCQPESDDQDGAKADPEESMGSEGCFLPGTHAVFIRTWGCAHNSSDGEYMAGQLADQGYRLTEDREAADVWILNSCTVKSPAEDHFRNEVERGLASGKKVIVAGCVPQGRPKADYIRGLSTIGVQQIDRVVEVVEETLKGNQVRFLGQKRVKVIADDDDDVVADDRVASSRRKAGGAPLQLPKVRRNPLVEIIAISTGCLNQCTYCKTKHARGELGSYPIAEIVARAEQSFREGVVEVWLTSEDLGAYGRDLGNGGASLPDLLWRLVEVVPDGCRLRLGMTNPPYILDHLEEMSKVLNHPRVYKFLHVPVQSGSDAVLSAMRREYDVDDFCRVVNVLRNKVKGLTVATDVICGFPTETPEDFEETLGLCRRYKFPSLFINQFYSRPGTPAAKMKRLASTKEVKLRTKALNDLFHSYEPYKDRVGKEYLVLVTEVSHDGIHLVGHNDFYEQVLLPKEDEQLLGKAVVVRITHTSKFSMRGQVVSAASSSPAQLAPELIFSEGQQQLVSAAGRKAKGPKKNPQQNPGSADLMQEFMYKSSLVILVIAVGLRLLQLMYFASVHNPQQPSSSSSPSSESMPKE